VLLHRSQAYAIRCNFLGFVFSISLPVHSTQIKKHNSIERPSAIPNGSSISPEDVDKQFITAFVSVSAEHSLACFVVKK